MAEVRDEPGLVDAVANDERDLRLIMGHGDGADAKGANAHLAAGPQGDPARALREFHQPGRALLKMYGAGKDLSRALRMLNVVAVGVGQHERVEPVEHVAGRCPVAVPRSLHAQARVHEHSRAAAFEEGRVALAPAREKDDAHRWTLTCVQRTSKTVRRWAREARDGVALPRRGPGPRPRAGGDPARRAK